MPENTPVEASSVYAAADMTVPVGIDAVAVDAARVRAWLDDPDRPQELAGLDVAPDQQATYPSYHDPWLFLTAVEDLVDAADDAGLFGDHGAVSVRLTADGDGLYGAYVMLDVPRPAPDHSTRPVRFASRYQDPADLIDDTTATGAAAAVSILHAVARSAAEMLTHARDTLGPPPPAPARQQRLCGCGAHHDIHTDDQDDTGDPDGGASGEPDDW